MARCCPITRKEETLLSIIQAAGWPIWPLIACSVLGLALIFERFMALKTARVAPPKLLDEAITVSSKAVPTPDVVNQLAQNSALGEVLASGLRTLNSNPQCSETDVRGARLDQLPSPMVSSIQAVKTLTAEYDPHGLGGQVNLVTRSAFDNPDGFIVVNGALGHASSAGGFVEVAVRENYRCGSWISRILDLVLLR